MNPLTEQLVIAAASQVGAREVGGNNLGPAVVKYQQATWLVPGPWPWCAAFVAWCLREWLMDPGVRQYFKLNETTLKAFLFRGTNMTSTLDWAKAHGMQILPKGTLAEAGDLILFDWQGDTVLDHIGIVTDDQVSPDDNIKTIEGNASALATSDSPKGDGVVRQLRSPKLVGKLVRMIV